MNEEVRLSSPKNDSGEADPPDWVLRAIKEHESGLLRYAQHFVFDLETARDVVQDTFLQMCRKANDEIRPRLAQWLYTVCRNRAIDVCRKERRMKLASEDHLANSVADKNDPQQNPVAAMEKEEAAAGLIAQVSTLPDRQQEILRLKFNAGLSYQEIAEVTGLTSTNVGFILHTAISKLRVKLQANA